MPNVEVLVIVTVTDDDGPIAKSFHGLGMTDSLAALKNADRALDLIMDEDAAWTENLKYRFQQQLKIYAERRQQEAMDLVDEGRHGQGA